MLLNGLVFLVFSTISPLYCRQTSALIPNRSISLPGLDLSTGEEDGDYVESDLPGTTESPPVVHTLPVDLSVAKDWDSDLSISYANQIHVMNNRRKLARFLMKDYDKAQVPSRSKPVNVSLHMWPYDILYVNEAKSSIKISGWIDMYWTDEFLVWDPEDFGGIEDVFFPTDNVWQPRIDIFYSKEDPADMPSCSNCYVRVDSQGRVLRGLYFAYSFPCRINVKYFPFDQQKCEVEVANWYMDLRLVDLWPTGNQVDMSVFLPNEEWDLLNISVIRKSTYYIYGQFPSLVYRIVMKRKPFYYVCNLIIPSLIITTTAVVGYHMPSTGLGLHLEKVKMGLTAILSIFILQLGISDKMPRTSDVIPLISIFYFCLVLILSLAIPATSLVIVVEKQGLKGKRVPKFWRRLCLCSNDTTIEDYLAGLSTLDKVKPVSRKSSIRKKNTKSPSLTNLPDASPGHTKVCELESLIHQEGGSPKCKRRSINGVYYYNSDVMPPDYSSTLNNNTIPNSTTSPNILDATQNGKPRNWISNQLGVPISLQEEVRGGIRDIRDFIKERREREIIRRDWSILADSLERLSMLIFLSFIALSVTLFWFHDWY